MKSADRVCLHNSSSSNLQTGTNVEFGFFSVDRKWNSGG
jgi:hypothetical protein